jgi:hypothetical protein
MTPRPITCAACRDHGPLPCLCAVVEHVAAEMGRHLPRLLALPLCPCEEHGRACLAPVLPDPRAVGRLECMAGHAWHEGGRQGEPAPLWSEATRMLEAWRRRGWAAVDGGRWTMPRGEEVERWRATY